MEQMTREIRKLKNIFIKIFNIDSEIPQQPLLRVTFAKPLRRISTLFYNNETIFEVLKTPTTTFFKSLRRISTLFLNNEAISEVLKIEDSVFRYQIPNPASSFKSLQRISIFLSDNLFAFECLKAGGSADDSISPQQSPATVLA